MSDVEFKKSKKKKAKTGKQVYILLDRSGSMASSWDETIGSINGYVDELEDDIKVNLYTFDTVGFDKVRSQKAGQWEAVTITEITPRGGTPLYDAAGKVMDEIFENDVAKSLFVVMTDGYENASKEYTLEAVKGKIELLKTKDWPIIFLGADFQDVTRYTTATFNVDVGQTVNLSAARRSAGMGMMAGKTQSYMSGGGATAMDWTEQEKASLETTVTSESDETVKPTTE